MKATSGAVYLSLLLRNSPVNFSRYAWMYLKTSRGYVYVCHPENYSQNPVQLGQQLWATHRAPDGSKPHVVLAHTHLMQREKARTVGRKLSRLGQAVRHSKRSTNPVLPTNITSGARAF